MAIICLGRFMQTSSSASHRIRALNWSYRHWRFHSTPYSYNSDDEEEDNDGARIHSNAPLASARRVWRHNNNETTSATMGEKFWNSRIDERRTLEEIFHDIQIMDDDDDESSSNSVGGRGGRMRQTQLGVLHRDPGIELRHLVDNYTVTAIASALRDREDALQYAATLSEEGKTEELAEFLRLYHPRYILERRSEKYQTTKDPVQHLHLESARQVLRKALMRMPRTVSTSFTRRAGVCLALACVQNAAVVVLEKRAANLRSHPDEVCLPGGMVCDSRDQTIVETSIREMKEEIHGLEHCNVEVLGILRLNWGEVHHLTGVAVTPVVCYLGELPEHLSPSPDEVSEVFTIPLKDLIDNEKWVHKEGLAPIYVGGPHVIWGLTGYILERFRKDILSPNHAKDKI